MADYHIYLHSDTVSTGNKTTPRQNKVDANGEEPSNFAQVKKGFQIAKGVAQGQAVNMGVSALEKVAPYVAGVVAVAKITDKVLTTGFAHQEEYTGNFQNNVNYNNFKATMSAIFNPIGYALTIQHQQAQFRKQNIATQQQNTLLGNSVLKNFNIGV